MLHHGFHHGMLLILGKHSPFSRGFPGGLDGKEPACNAEDLGSVPGLGGSLEEDMTTHSSILS